MARPAAPPRSAGRARLAGGHVRDGPGDRRRRARPRRRRRCPAAHLRSRGPLRPLARRRGPGPGPGRHGRRGRGDPVGLRRADAALVLRLVRDHAARERRVLELLCRGAAPKQIARLLGLSAHTVNDHQKAVFRKTSAAGRDELMAAFTTSTAIPSHGGIPGPPSDPTMKDHTAARYYEHISSLFVGRQPKARRVCHRDDHVGGDLQKGTAMIGHTASDDSAKTPAGQRLGRLVAGPGRVDAKEFGPPRRRPGRDRDRHAAGRAGNPRVLRRGADRSGRTVPDRPRPRPRHATPDGLGVRSELGALAQFVAEGGPRRPSDWRSATTGRACPPGHCRTVRPALSSRCRNTRVHDLHQRQHRDRPPDPSAGSRRVARQLSLFGHRWPRATSPLPHHQGVLPAQGHPGHDSGAALPGSATTPSASPRYASWNGCPCPTVYRETWPLPYHIDDIEWFASPADVCHAYAGLLRLDQPEIHHALSGQRRRAEGPRRVPVSRGVVQGRQRAPVSRPPVHYLVRTAGGCALATSLMVSDPTTPLDVVGVAAEPARSSGTPSTCWPRHGGPRRLAQPTAAPNHVGRWRSRSSWSSPIHATWPSGPEQDRGRVQFPAGVRRRGRPGPPILPPRVRRSGPAGARGLCG